ncbi:MAG: pyrimidine dimer DNA glycosylase/endonuclease V [Gemmatimonadaceae bacterium]
MRIWDVEPELLCRQHLLGEHRELHGLWIILAQGKRGYSAHPETRRWVGKLAALYSRHELLVKEMERRGYAHASPLSPELATGSSDQEVVINTVAEQLALLRGKACPCLLERQR